MTINTHICGVLQLTSPLHVTTTDAVSLNKATGRVQYNDQGLPLTGTMTQAMLINNKVQRVPYFPANDLRGRLRRKAAGILLNALSSKKIKVPVGVYSGLMCGSATANPDGQLTIEEVQRATRHIYMGIFGGGARIIESGFAARDMLPIMRAFVQSGVIPKTFSPSAADLAMMITEPGQEDGDSDGRNDKLSNEVHSGDEAFRLLGLRHIVRIDDVQRVWNHEDLIQHIEGGEEAILAHQGNTIASDANRRSEGEKGENVKKTTLANIVSVQTIITGTKLFLHLDLADRLTKAQIGLMVSALLELMNEQALGAMGRMGFGRFIASDIVLRRHDKKVPVFEEGADGAYKLSAAMDSYVEAMREELAAETLETVSPFFSGISGKSTEKTSKKKGKEIVDEESEEG